MLLLLQLINECQQTTNKAHQKVQTTALEQSKNQNKSDNNLLINGEREENEQKGGRIQAIIRTSRVFDA